MSCSEVTTEVIAQPDKQYLVSDVQSMDAVIKTHKAHQMLGNKLRHRTSDGALFHASTQITLPSSWNLFTDGQMSNISAAENYIVDCNNTEYLAGSHSHLVSSQHLPLHDVVINKVGIHDFPFTLREESVFQQIVCNGNVEFCPGVAILIEPVSSEALSWFLPGDQLIAINDVIIESKDQAWCQVSQSKQETLKLSVRPLAELSELSTRHMHFHSNKDTREVSFLNSKQEHNMHVSIKQL